MPYWSRFVIRRCAAQTHRHAHPLLSKQHRHPLHCHYSSVVKARLCEHKLCHEHLSILAWRRMSSASSNDPSLDTTGDTSLNDDQTPQENTASQPSDWDSHPQQDDVASTVSADARVTEAFVASLLGERPPTTSSPTVLREKLSNATEPASARIDNAILPQLADDISPDKIPRYTSIMNACLRQGDMERARRIFMRLRTLDKRLFSADLYNRFLAGYAQRLLHQHLRELQEQIHVQFPSHLRPTSTPPVKTDQLSLSSFIDNVLSRWHHFGPRKPGGLYNYPIATTDLNSIRHTQASLYTLEEMVRCMDDLKWHRVVPNATTYGHMLHAAALVQDEQLGRALLSEFARWGHSLADLASHPILHAKSHNILSLWTRRFSSVSLFGKDTNKDTTKEKDTSKDMNKDTAKATGENKTDSPSLTDTVHPTETSDTTHHGNPSAIFDRQSHFEESESLREFQEALKPLSEHASNLYELQQNLEMKSIEAAVQRFQRLDDKSNHRHNASTTTSTTSSSETDAKEPHLNYSPSPRLNTLIVEWQRAMVNALQEEFLQIEANSSGHGTNGRRCQEILREMKESKANHQKSARSSMTEKSPHEKETVERTSTAMNTSSDPISDPLSSSASSSSAFAEEVAQGEAPFFNSTTRVPGSETALRAIYGPFLTQLSPEKLSVIALNELIGAFHSSLNSGAIRSVRLLVSLGRAVESEINLEHLIQHKDALQMSYLNHHRLRQSGKLFNMALRRAISHLDDAESRTDLHWMGAWPTGLRARVGAALVKLLIDSCRVTVDRLDASQAGPPQRVTESVNAFHHTYLFEDGKKVGIVKPHTVLEELWGTACRKEFIHPRLLPMVVPPRLWVRYNSGGYLFLRTQCMRIRHCPEQQEHLRVADQAGRLSDVLAGLDVLGATAWRINDAVLAVVERVWQEGGGRLNIPSRRDQPLPAMPDNYDSDPVARKRHIQQRRAVQTANRNLHSLRCDVHYKLEIASQYRGQHLYFPHSLDFRGRAYPIPPLLNHLGNDLCRGLLTFAEGRPLGERGLYWLKVHLANLYGMDKHQFDDRVSFVERHRAQILDSVDAPLDGEGWWQAAEDPWQCLAACYELARAWRSPVPEAYLSQLPIHLDGSCNGLQHYAALGGDMEGAREVNLMPSETPQDVYSGVAELIERALAVEKDSHPLAAKLAGRISRKVVKQTVMTNVYGVTFMGARNQIEVRLAELMASGCTDIQQDELSAMAGYLVSKVFFSLRQMFRGAREIQDWLTHSAREIAYSVEPMDVMRARSTEQAYWMKKKEAEEEAVEEGGLDGEEKSTTQSSTLKKSSNAPLKINNTAVSWTTPLGLTIVQPYRKAEPKTIRTSVQTVLIHEFDKEHPVDVLKQRAGFPPNFIHSLDATHMLMTAHACHERDIVFASVHDSYWTHASCVDEMNGLIRDSFVKLHEQPIMDLLRKEFVERYGHRWVPENVSRGNAESAGQDQDIDDTEDEVTDFTVESETTGEKTASSAQSSSANQRKSARRSGPYALRDKGHRCPPGYRPIRFRPVPARGDFKVADVKKSLYFFD